MGTWRSLQTETLENSQLNSFGSIIIIMMPQDHMKHIFFRTELNKTGFFRFYFYFLTPKLKYSLKESSAFICWLDASLVASLPERVGAFFRVSKVRTIRS